MIQRSTKRAGFTLIELMLAMSFVGMLLIAIAMTTMQIMNTYNKGATIREVNTVGRAVTEDLQRTIATSVPFTVTPKVGAEDDPADSKYVENRGIDGETYGGRLCTGAYTYVWNYGKVRELADPGDPGREPAPNTYENSDELIRLVKVRDAGGMLCANITRRVNYNHARELLAAGDRNLAVQEMKITSGRRDSASGQALYAIALVLGTNDQEQLAASKTCLPPNEGSGYEDFCAINQFNIIARAGNRSGSL